MMFLVAPGSSAEADDEMRQWCQETQARIQKFSNLHPDYLSFRAFTFDNTKSIPEQFREAITDIIAKTLPRELATTPMRMAGRNHNWPLVLRATYYPGIHSIFELWGKCTKSKDFEYGIHIWANGNNIASELAALEKSRETCIDITGLLTLAEFDILDNFSSRFDRIFLARGTKQLVDLQLTSLLGTDPLSDKIEKWRVRNIAKIRTRRAAESSPRTNQTPMNIITQESMAIDKHLGGGVGESLLLARKLGIPLFSDESSVRVWAISEYGVNSFSTLALLRSWEQAKKSNIFYSIQLQAKMIERNYRTIPFGAGHLIEPLKEILKRKNGSITSENLLQDSILGVYLKEFGESLITIDSLAVVAMDWWITVVFDRDIPTNCLTACLEPPSRALVLWRTIAGVLGRVDNEPESRAAVLWAGFLWRCYRRDDEQVETAWRSIKECCACIFPGQYETQRTVLYRHMPRQLSEYASKDPGLSSHQKLSLYIGLPWKLPLPDRNEWENEFFKHSAKFAN